MDTNTLLNIYQSYTLTKVSEINKQSLIAAYAQNEQLNKLNKELSRANRTSNQILRNQIKEIELREKQRYYKNLTFNLSQVMTSLENEDNVNFRIFASELFLSPVCNMAKDAIQELDEIADKEYAQNIIKRAHSLSDNDKAYIESYQDSPWATVLDTKSKINTGIIKEIRNKKKEIRLTTIRKNEAYKKEEQKVKNEEGCVGCLAGIVIIFGLAFVGTIVTHDYEATLGSTYILVPAIFLLLALVYTRKTEKNKETNNVKTKLSEVEVIKEELEKLSDELLQLQQDKTRLTTQYNELLQEINLDCPKWESKLSEIAEILPHGEKEEDRDPLLFDAATLLVSTQQGSTSLIQRKFSIGYNRANKIMDQLETFGVVGPANGSNPREVLFESEEELLEIQKEMES